MQDALDSLVYLNGKFLSLSEAAVPVLDRGFIFGDGVYEVIPIYEGKKAFRIEHHLRRLARSLAAIHIQNPHDNDTWKDLIKQIAHSSEDSQLIYIHVTRGVAKRTHAFPIIPVAPTIFMMSNPLVLPTKDMRTQGLHCVCAEDQRWLRCDIKSISLLGNILAKQQSVTAGAAETILFRNDLLTEGASSNVWIVRDGTLMAPLKNHLILEGVRYALIEELCAYHTIPFVMRHITREEVFSADEVMISSASREILPVTRLDNQQIGQGNPGCIYQQLHLAYQTAIQQTPTMF